MEHVMLQETTQGEGYTWGGWGAVADWQWGRKGGRDRRPSQGLRLPHIARQPAQNPDVLPEQQHPGPIHVGVVIP